MLDVVRTQLAKRRGAFAKDATGEAQWRAVCGLAACGQLSTADAAAAAAAGEPAPGSGDAGCCALRAEEVVLRQERFSAVRFPGKTSMHASPR